MPVFVLAAGESTRFEADYPKQHIEIEGERLLDRIMGQFSAPDARMGDPLLVTHEPERMGWNHEPHIKPSAHRFTAETFLSTERWWGSENWIIFSDVYFTNDAAATIRNCRLPLAFFTCGQDIFAIKFNHTRFHQLIPALEHTISRAELPEGNKGRMWEVYRHIYGMPNWPLEPHMNPKGVVFIGDRTQDFDTVQDLEDFRNGKSKNWMFSKSQANAEVRHGGPDAPN